MLITKNLSPSAPPFAAMEDLEYFDPEINLENQMLARSHATSNDPPKSSWATIASSRGGARPRQNSTFTRGRGRRETGRRDAGNEGKESSANMDGVDEEGFKLVHHRHNDIVLLQELMLMKDDVHLVKNVNDEWDSIVDVRDVITDGIMEGRPSKGVAILWRKSYSEFINPVYCNESIIGITINTADRKIFLLNVYMPYDDKTNEAVHKYIDSLSKIKTLINEAKTNYIMVIGDFNVNYYKVLPKSAKLNVEEKFVYWTKMSESELDAYKRNLYERINNEYFLNNDIFLCS
ncbi:unnamed protein product [Rotaria magnacalcarata]|uniref:Endonuclease/exonuclease/phosphatase domain-containing protein n=1 Tax=Rotaria magnacalcarata TaxID=392030 RepID=A0A816NRR6_9BILA|nr:unnamed protein product [Rotaria magnacalcarata]